MARGVEDDHRVDRRQCGQHRRADQPQVGLEPGREAMDARRQERHGTPRVGHEAHEDGQGNEDDAHDRAPLSADSGSGPNRMTASCSTSRRLGGTSMPSTGPSTPPAMMPAAGSQASETPTPMTAPEMAATSSRRPAIRPTARPAIAAGKITSSPNRVGSGMLPPIVTPTSVAMFHGIHVLTIAPIQ